MQAAAAGLNEKLPAWALLLLPFAASASVSFSLVLSLADILLFLKLGPSRPNEQHLFEFLFLTKQISIKILSEITKCLFQDEGSRTILRELILDRAGILIAIVSPFLKYLQCLSKSPPGRTQC